MNYHTVNYFCYRKMSPIHYFSHYLIIHIFVKVVKYQNGWKYKESRQNKLAIQNVLKRCVASNEAVIGCESKSPVLTRLLGNMQYNCP